MSYNYLKHYRNPATKRPVCRYGQMADAGRRIAFFVETPAETTCARCRKALGLPPLER